MSTIVLVHGTTGGGWTWRTIAPTLRAARHRVTTPTLTGLGERVHLASPAVDLDTHIADVVNHLIYEELDDVILVGHSYGGMVITGVADRAPERIARLIYFDAMIPRDGESAVTNLPAAMREGTARRVREEGDGWLIPIARGPNDVATLNTPHPYKTWTQPIRLQNPAREAIPGVHVLFTADKGPGAPFAQVFNTSLARAREAGWPIYEVDTVHQITPDPKADVLLRILAEQPVVPR